MTTLARKQRSAPFNLRAAGRNGGLNAASWPARTAVFIAPFLISSKNYTHAWSAALEAAELKSCDQCVPPFAGPRICRYLASHEGRKKCGVPRRCDHCDAITISRRQASKTILIGPACDRTQALADAEKVVHRQAPLVPLGLRWNRLDRSLLTFRGQTVQPVLEKSDE